MDPRLAPALRELNRLLAAAAVDLNAQLRFALLGGLAVSTWGVIRATQDIDFLADSDPSPIRDLTLRDKLAKFIERQNCRADWHVGDFDDPIPLLLKIEMPAALGKVGADILWAHKRWQREAFERAVDVDVDGSKIPVLHPEDLILMKLDAGGPQDLLDVEQLLTVGQPRVDLVRLKKSASRLRLRGILAKCLGDISGKK
jgi:predicted nucleotidyltransferase